MEYIQSFIDELIENRVVAQWVVIILFASATFVISMAIYSVFSDYFSPFRARLKEIGASRKKSVDITEFLDQKIGILGKLVSPGKDEKSELSQRMLYAGIDPRTGIATYHGIRLILSIGFAAFSLIGSRYLGSDMDTDTIFMVTTIFGILGWVGPSFYLDKLIAERQRKILNGFPDMIDQLVICTEAGLGLDAGLLRVAQDSSVSNTEMAEELAILNAELRTGVTREDALRNLYLRTGVEDVSSLVSAISQSMKFGSSIGDTLRIFSDDLRDRRMQAAEERAEKLTVTILFPLVFCFFPGTFIVILGPAALSMSTVFSGIL